jgi:hypothetical protein
MHIEENVKRILVMKDRDGNCFVGILKCCNEKRMCGPLQR